MATEQTGTNQSVERAAAVLAAFSPGRPMRVADVADKVGLGQSTTSRLLATLESLEYVERDPVGGLYRLGPALISLAGVALNQNPIHRHARQVAQELAARVELGANVAIRRSDTLIYLCNFEGKRAPKAFVLAGQHNPLYATGLGKCLLGALSGDERRALLPSLPAFTPNTATTHEELDRIVADISRTGYAVECEELAFGRACVAAPILDSQGAVAAALSISGPLSAIDLPSREAELARTVIEVADAISVELGYLGPDPTSVHLQAART